MREESWFTPFQIPDRFQERIIRIGASNLTCEELEQRRIDQINNTPGKMTGYDCTMCMNRGYFARLDSQRKQYGERCSCIEKRKSLSRIKNSGLEPLMSRYTMENWQVREPWQAKARDMALRYAANPDNHLFYMSGTVGAGKSHLCTALTGLLIERGFEAIYMLWRDVSIRAKASVNDDSKYQAIIDPLKRIPLLYIDDLFKAGKNEYGELKITAADIQFAFELINARYCNPELLTIISSELSTNDIMNIDPALGSRIYERSKGYVLLLEDKVNWRLNHA